MGKTFIGSLGVLIGVLPYGLKIPGADSSLNSLLQIALVCIALLGAKMLLAGGKRPQPEATERVNDPGHRESVMRSSKAKSLARPEASRNKGREAFSE